MIIFPFHSLLGSYRGKCTEHARHTEFQDKYSVALQENGDRNIFKGWFIFFCETEKPTGGLHLLPLVKENGI